MQPSELLARLVELNRAGQLLLLRSLLLHLDGIVGQVTEGSVAVHRAPVCLVGSTAHESAHLVLQREVLLLQLVILLLDPQMVLNLLRLVVVAHLHLVRLRLLKLLLQALLLISESFEGEHDLFDLVFALLKHLFLLAVLSVKSLAFPATLLLVAARVLDLAVLYLDQLSQIVVLFLESLVL